MFAGKRFRLTIPILAVNVEDHIKSSTVHIPSGAILEVVSGPTDGDGMMDVLWDGRNSGGVLDRPECPRNRDRRQEC